MSSKTSNPTFMVYPGQVIGNLYDRASLVYSRKSRSRSADDSFADLLSAKLRAR